MTYSHVLGIDVSKKTLEVAILDVRSEDVIVRRRYNNQPGAIRLCIKNHCRSGRPHVVMEATGTYHLLLWSLLNKAQVDCSVANPFQTKRFSDMKLNRFKHDKPEARTLARFGYEQRPRLAPRYCPEQQAIKTLTTALNQLKKQRDQSKNLMESVGVIPNDLTSVKQTFQEHLRQIEQHIKEVKAQRQALIDQHHAETYELLTSIPGIGPEVANTVIGYLGDMGQFDHAKQIAAFMGINPLPRQSGTSVKSNGHISKRGHPDLRTKFYMAALSASRFNPQCKEFYHHLLDNGKRKKVALIAVANKLIHIMFAVVSKKTPFDSNYHKNCDNNLDK